ncbi:TIR domain-containing protein [Streptomyces sp. NPDC005248]|uniref:TIR domain-containing protein n=1 Tax=Streptomyces sp. NPDC005248 TaxID=3364709 RepID=UPI00369B9E35
MPKRVFVSFDYDYDKALKDFLIGQAKNPDSPFAIHDWSIKEASPDWRGKARARIRASDAVIVICGENTDKAVGVAIELKIAQEEGIDYFLLNGYSGQNGRKPTTAKATDKVYQWTWENLKLLIGGAR